MGWGGVGHAPYSNVTRPPSSISSTCTSHGVPTAAAPVRRMLCRMPWQQWHAGHPPYRTTLALHRACRGLASLHMVCRVAREPFYGHAEEFTAVRATRERSSVAPVGLVLCGAVLAPETNRCCTVGSATGTVSILCGECRLHCRHSWKAVAPVVTECGTARAQSRCGCGRGEPNPGADVVGVSSIPAQMGQAEPSPDADVAGRADS